MTNTKVQSEQIADDAVVTSHIADSVGLGGSPTTTTQSASDNSTKIATTAYVDAAFTALVDSSPAALNTLNELAAALGDDANFSTTVTNSIATKLPLAGGTMTGDLILGDDVKAIFGAGSDLQIYHDGSNSFIDNSSGSLTIDSGVHLFIKNVTGESLANFLANDAVELYYDNAKKLATTSSGVDVTGTLTATTLAGTLSTAAQTNITSLGTLTSLTVDDITINDSTISDAANFTIDVGGDIILDADGQQIFLKDGGVSFGMLSTDSTPSDFIISSRVDDKDIIFRGIDGSSDITALRLDMSDAGKAVFNSGAEFHGLVDNQISHSSTDVTEANSNATLRIGNVAAGNGIYNAIKFSANQQDMYIMSFNNSAQADRRMGFFLGSVAGDAVADERLSIRGDGKVGIGTTSPAHNLHVVSSGNAELEIERTGGAAVFTQAQSALGVTGTSSNHDFGLLTNGAVRMRIDNTGSVFMGGTSGSFNARLTLERETYSIESRSTGTGSEGHVVFRNGNGAVGSIFTNASATAYNTSSDYRLKENVDYTWDATTRLKQLKPARFNFKNDADNTVDGFLAHEVASIVPESITGTKDASETKTNCVLMAGGSVFADGVTEAEWTQGKTDGTYESDTTWVASKTEAVYQQIDQAKLVPLLVKTIQELEARIKTLEES